MDIVVKQTAEHMWALVDLLGRSAGSIELEPGGKFAVVPVGNAVEALKGIQRGPFATLDAALSAIETQTRGTCRMDENATVPDVAAQAPTTADVIDMPIREGDA